MSDIAKPGDNSRWHVLFASWLGELFDGMDASIYIIVAFPALSELLSTTSHSTTGLVGSVILAIFMLGWAAGAIVFGTLADYIGRTRTMMLTILLYAACTGLCATAHNWVELAFYRFLVGCGIGGEISIGAVMVSEYFRGKSRLHAVGALSTSFGCGYIIAALLNLWLGQWGWRSLFLAGVAPALMTLYIRSKLREPEQYSKVQDLKRALRAKPKSSLTPEQAALIGFTLPKLFAPENRRKTLVTIALASTAIIGYWAVLSWIPAWVNQLTGTNAVAERSQVAIAMNTGAIIAAIFGGHIMIKLGVVNAFRLSFIGSFLCCVSMFLTTKAFGAALLAWAFACGAFCTFPFVLLFTYVPELFSADIRGTAFGFSVQLGRVFAACAALLGGQIINGFNGSYPLAGSTVACAYLLGTAATVLMPKTSGEVELGVSVEATPVHATATSVPNIA